MSDSGDSFFTHSGSSPPGEREQVYSTSTKACTRCKKIKPITEFYPKGNRLGSRCKACEKDGKNKRYKMKRLSDKARLKKSKQIVDLDIGRIEILYTNASADLHVFEHFISLIFAENNEEVAA